ncbi:MAG: phosphonate metabolism transcriptional regulator PhnF [Pseudomonadota bacterium]
MTQAEPYAKDWRLAYRDLKAQIELGRLAPGASLPTLAELAGAYGLTTHGARRVMARLKEDGRVESWRGFGHRVSEKRFEYRIDERPRFGANMARLGRNNGSDVVATRAVRLSPKLARSMRLRAGTRVYQTEIVRYVEGRPVVLSQNHFPLDRFEGIDTALTKSKSVTRALALHGVDDYSRERTRIEVRMPNAHESLQLGIPSNQPVLVSTGTNVDRDGQVVELTHSVWRGDCVTFEI